MHGTPAPVATLTGTALNYWREYAASGVGMVLVVFAASSLGGVVVSRVASAALHYYALAAASLGLHLAAMLVRDVRRGDFEPPDADGRDGAELLVGLAFVAWLVTPSLLAASVGALAVDPAVGWPAALLVALYYPVADFEVFRRAGLSPGTVPLALAFVTLRLAGVVRADGTPRGSFERLWRNPPRLPSPT